MLRDIKPQTDPAVDGRTVGAERKCPETPAQSSPQTLSRSRGRGFWKITLWMELGS